MTYNEFNLKGCENQTGFEKFEPRKHLNPETDTSENSVCLLNYLFAFLFEPSANGKLSWQSIN